ncbi:GNAT family N-acetyltransferase [Mycobacterium sp. URHB0021]
MEARLHHSLDEFRAVAWPLYRRDAVVNTIELTLLLRDTWPDDSLLLTVWDGAEPVGAAIQTPPYPLLCNGIPVDAHHLVATHLAGIRPDLCGVRGRLDSALGFAEAWRSVTGGTGTMATNERLYRLGTLRPPLRVSGGAAREATGVDRSVLVDWVECFFVETLGHKRDEPAGEAFVDTAGAVGDGFILWVVDGVPVSMAMLRAPAADVSRIGPVFTPRDRRGRGYGSAVTAAAVESAHRTGVQDVVLFADLANPTSNGVYQRIGFDAVCDSVRIEFAAPSSD